MYINYNNLPIKGYCRYKNNNIVFEIIILESKKNIL